MSALRFDSSDSLSTGRRWWSAGATLFWVAVASVLVWVYADMEFTKTDEVALTIRLVARRSPDLVLLSKPAADPDAKILREIKAKVVLELRGNRRGLDVFIGKHNNEEVEHDVSKLLVPGDSQQISADKVVGESFREDMEKMGLSLRSASTIEGIHVDRRIRKEVPVKFVFEGADLAKTEIPPVGVWARRAQWEKIRKVLGSGGRMELLTVKLTVSKDLKGVVPGRATDVPVELTRKIAGVPVEPELSALTIPVTVEKFTDRKPFKVTVRFVIPYTWFEDGTWDAYKLVRETQQTTWVQGIEVTGPLADLQELEAEQSDAYILLKEDDKKKVESWLTRPVRFRVPPNLKVVTFTGKPPEVKFKLEPRKAGVTPPPTTP